MRLPQNVLDSPALAVLCDLENAGLDLAVVNGRLRVWPVERLVLEHEHQIQGHRDELVTLVRICDEGVQERLAAFKQALRKFPEGTSPDFVFRRGTSYGKAVCFSCGAALPAPRYGRCWRCSLAWRLAAKVSIPVHTTREEGVTPCGASAERRGRSPQDPKAHLTPTSKEPFNERSCSVSVVAHLGSRQG